MALQFMRFLLAARCAEVLPFAFAAVLASSCGHGKTPVKATSAPTATAPATAVSTPPAPPAAPPTPAAAATTADAPEDHTKIKHGVRHKPGYKQAPDNCTPCHGKDLKGEDDRPSCYTCHGKKWH